MKRISVEEVGLDRGVEPGSRGGAWWWVEVGERAIFIFFLDKTRANSSLMGDCHRERGGHCNTACVGQFPACGGIHDPGNRAQRVWNRGSFKSPLERLERLFYKLSK